jgi:hypothetical protein
MFDLQTINRMNSAGGLSKAEVKARFLGSVKVTRAANNSWCVDSPEPETDRVYIHMKTEVVHIYHDGSVSLDSGTWRTVTTKDRINRFQGVCSVYSERGRWIVCVLETGKRFRFDDGMLILPDGSVEDGVGRPMDALPEKRTRKVKEVQS